MEQGSTLLQFVHKNAEMGRGAIPQVLEVVEEPKLRAALNRQLEEYETILFCRLLYPDVCLCSLPQLLQPYLCRRLKMLL